MKRIIFLNGEWLQEDKAKVSVFDAGFLYGFGIFETIRIVDGRALFLAEHLRRLKKSLKITGIKGVSENFDLIVKTISKKNNIVNGVVRITITAGRLNDLPWLCNYESPTVLVSIREFEIPEHIYKQGVNVVFVNEKKASSLPGVKSTSYIANVISKIYAKKKGAFEAIFVSPEGFLKEGGTSNLFFIKNKIVYTPALTLGILPGVTRKLVIKIIKKMGLKIKEGHYRISDFNQSEEAFLTNSTYGIVPVAGKRASIVNEIYSRLPSCMQRQSSQSLQL